MYAALSSLNSRGSPQLATRPFAACTAHPARTPHPPSRTKAPRRTTFAGKPKLASGFEAFTTWRIRRQRARAEGQLKAKIVHEETQRLETQHNLHLALAEKEALAPGHETV